MLLPLHPWSPAVWIVGEPVVAIANKVAVTIAVLLVHDAVAVEITVRTIKACLAPLITRAALIEDVGDSIAVVVAVRAATLPMLSVLESTIVMAPIVVGRGRVERPGLHIHRCRLHVGARYLHADGELHIATGVRRLSRRENAERDRKCCERFGVNEMLHEKLLELV